ncbi:Similar to APN1: Aminopeptidase N (Plutella xylostella), partial [Cotesia congregata]
MYLFYKLKKITKSFEKEELYFGNHIPRSHKYTYKNKSEAFIYITYRDRFKGKRWLLLTNIKSNQDACKIFPYLLEDEPTKVTLELSVQHNRSFTALSNTQYNSIIASSESFKNVWTNFDKTPLLLTRELNLIIGNLECSTYYGEEYHVWTLKNVENNHKNLSIVGGKVWKAMKNITRIIDGDTVIKKFDFVLLHGIDLPPIDPFFSYGIIVANSEKFSYGEYHSNFPSINQFAHQIAFSICMQWYPLYIFHSNIGNEYFLQYGLINYLILATADQTNEPEHATDEIIYQVIDSNELAIKLIKVMHVVGKVNFLNLLHELILKRSHSGVLEKNYLVNKYSEVLKVDVVTFKEFLGSQILTNGYPVVTVTRNYTASNAVVTQKRFSKSLTKNFSEKYWIPLSWANESSPNFDDTSINWWLSPDSHEIEIPVTADSTSWIICNKQIIGAYLSDIAYQEKIKKIENIFCNGIREAGQKSWDRLFKVYYNYRQIEILKALGCSSNRVILQKYMILVLHSNWAESNHILVLMFRIIAEKSVIGVDTI